jgi:hypothetical protein
MMGERQVDQGALFYEFSLEKQVPADHMLRSIDRFVDLVPVRTHLVHWRIQRIQLGEDLPWGLGPGEGLGVGVVLGDVAVDRGLQVDH